MYLYTEKSTRLIYEAKFFDDFVLYQPASPDFKMAVERKPYGEFLDEFEEYVGNWDDARRVISGSMGIVSLN